MADHSDLAERLQGTARFGEIDAIDRLGNSALQTAASSGHASVVHALLNHSRFTAMTLHNALGHNALHMAACKGHPAAARELLMHSRFPRQAVNAVTTEDGATALHVSVQSGHLALVLLLLQSEDFNTVCHHTAGDHRTALHLAAKGRHHEIIAALLQNKRFEMEAIDIGDTSGHTALHIMVESGDLIALRLLKESGKFRVLETRSKQHGTALDIARIKQGPDHPQAHQLLVSGAATANIQFCCSRVC